MGIKNRDGALFTATGIDNSGLYAGRREAMGIIKAMAGQITSFDVFSGIGISAATAFASAAKSSYDFEKEFQKNMLEVATISTQVEGSMTDFMNRVMAITQEIPVKAPEAAKALYQIVSAGHDGADGMNVLEVAARSAIGGMTDTATAADAITTLINAYKLSASDAERVSDQLFTTARLGKTTFGELGQSIAQVAPIAASYGVEMDQVLAAVATLTKSGTPTAQAMTQIRAAIVGVSKYLGDGTFNTMTFQDALDKVAKEANGSESALRAMIPEIEAVNGVLGMTGIKAQDAAADLKAMNESAGSTEAAFKLMMNDVDKQMTLLSNNIQAALRPMGQAILKEVSEVATAFNEAFENGEAKEAMKTLGDLIVIVTGAFIGYKGSVLGSAAAHNIYARAMVVSRLAAIKHVTTTKLMTNAIKAQTVALLKNTAAFLTNPYVLAAAAVAALGYAVYKYATQATAAEKATAAHNKRVKDLSDWAKKTKEDVDGMLSSLRDENVLMTEKIEIYKALRKLYPDELENISLQNFLLMDSVQANNLLAKALDERIKAQQRADVNVIESEMKTNDSRIASLEGKNGMNTSVGEWFELRRLKSRNEQLKIEYEKAKDIVIQGLKDEAAARKAAEDLNNDNEKGETVLQRKIALTKELSDAEVKLKKLRAQDSTAKNSEIKAAEDKVKEVKSKLEALTGISGKESDKLKQTQIELARAILDSELKLQASRISAMEDGRAKRIALAKQETKDTIAAIQKEKQEYQQKIKETKGKEDPTVITTFDNRELAAKAKEKTDIALIEKEYAEEYTKRTKALTDVFLNEEQRKLSAIKERYNQERKWANEQLRTGGMTKNEHKSYTSNIDKAEQKETYRSMLDDLNDYKQQEKDLREKWDTNINTAVEAKDAYLVAKLQEGKQKALSALNGQMLQESTEWQQLFGNLDHLTVAQLEKLSGTIKKKAKDLKLNPVDAQAVTNSLKDVDEQIRAKNPFESLSKHLKEYKAAENDAAKKDSLKEMFRDTAASIDMVKGGFDAVVGGLTDMGLAGDEATQQLLGDISNLMGAASQLATGIASANPVSIIQGGIGVLTSVFNIFNSDRKHERKIKELQKEVDSLSRAYDRLGRAIENTYTNEVYNLMDGQVENLKKQQQLVLQQMREEQEKKHSDDDKIQEYQDKYEELGNQIEDTKKKQIEMLAGTDIQSAIDNFADALVDAYAQGEDGAKAMGETTKKVLANAVKEALKKQILGKALENAVTQLGKDMEDGVLTDAEKKQFEDAANSAGNRFMEAMKMYDDLFKDATATSTREATAKGIASISQDSANAIDGKMSSQLIFLDKTLVEVTSIREQMSFIRELQIRGWEDVRAIRELSSKVSDNTNRIAELSEKIVDVSDKIEVNTSKAARTVQDIKDSGLILKKQ